MHAACHAQKDLLILPFQNSLSTSPVSRRITTPKCWHFGKYWLIISQRK